jgi:hypothetical protein
MLKLLVITGAIITTLFLQSGQPAKTYKVDMPMQDWQAIMSVIDDSPTPGEWRKGIINRIQIQLQGQMKPDTTLRKH